MSYRPSNPGGEPPGTIAPSFTLYVREWISDRALFGGRGSIYAPPMSFGLGHGRDLDDAPGVVGVAARELPPLPDDILARPAAGRVDPRAWFTASALPLELEIGSGKGTFILNQAEADAGTNYLGIEWAREFYLYAADRVRRRGLGNVRMLHADAGEFLRWRCPAAILRVIHLYFSDPWPKRRHHKNRVVQHAFLGEAWRCLIPGGELRIVTDHDELWAWDQQHFAPWTRRPDAGGDSSLWPAQFSQDADPPFEMLPFTPPAWVGEGQVVGTNYERKMCGQRGPHACVLKKRSTGIGR